MEFPSSVSLPIDRLSIQEDYKPEDNHGSSQGVSVSYHAKTIMELNLSRPLIKACESIGYIQPTRIQAACIPLALTGRDVFASARLGSGMTAAYALPTLERLLNCPNRVSAIRVLILTPVRDLAIQVHYIIEALSQFTDIRCCLIVGGQSNEVQASALRSKPDIVVSTPGQMIDHLRNSMSVNLDDLVVLILDEVDRLQFAAEIQELVRMCPKRRQTMLFSDRMNARLDELVELTLTKPLRVSTLTGEGLE